jgi:hypothetical protein
MDELGCWNHDRDMESGIKYFLEIRCETAEFRDEEQAQAARGHGYF